MRRPFTVAIAAMLLSTLAPGAARADDPGPEPYEHLQWGLDMIDAQEAWSTATGDGVVVAVIDDGVDDDHPELQGRFDLENAVSWWDCGLTVVPPCQNPAAWDGGWHGTHMTGIIAAPRNGTGIAGVAPDVKIMPVRTANYGGLLPNLDPEKFWVSFYYTALGIVWAVDHGADVINLSLGSPIPLTSNAGGYAYLWAAAIEYAFAHDVLVVAAAGNEGMPICSNEYFVLGRDALCVGGVDVEEQSTDFANTGPGLDVVAPAGEGTDCSDPAVRARHPLSIFPVNVSHFCPVEDGLLGYEHWSGTSQATAFVTGVAALLAEQGIRGRDAARHIVMTARDLGDCGWDPEFGSGLVDARRAVETPATAGPVQFPGLPCVPIP